MPPLRLGLLNGSVLIIFCILSAFFAETRTLPAKLSFTPRQSSACALVTRADVEESIGRPVNEGNEETQGPASTCDYESKAGLVSITMQRLTAKPNLHAEIAALREQFPDSAVREAPGFAEAFYLDLPGAGTQLHVVNGSTGHLMVSILGFGEAPQVSGAAARIARKAIGRL